MTSHGGTAAAASALTAFPKEIIRHKGCTLFPQNPNLPPPSTRPRPPGCKTVFVGGLPENAGDDVIREVFAPCGDIVALRKSKKNFCHIRFSREFMVDRALCLSGYRLRLGSGADKRDSGKIHVDFAQARDDLYDWECTQRLLEREKRHRRQEGDALLRRDGVSPSPQTPDSPPLMPPFSEREAASLAECLKDKHRFSWAASVLLWWLDGGHVTRAGANHVYALIQRANAHAGRLRREAAQQRRALRKARAAFRCAMAAILVQMEQVSSVLVASGRQKSRDRFSKAQRKNIDLWTRQCQAQGDEVSGLRRGDDEEDGGEDGDQGGDQDEDQGAGGPFRKKPKMLRDRDGAEAWQHVALEHGAELLRKEAEPPTGKALPRRVQAEQHVREALSPREELAGELAEDRFRRPASRPLGGEKVNGVLWWSCAGGGPGGPAGSGGGGDGPEGVLLSHKEALLLGVMSAFLHVHPFGANLEYLCSYVHTLDSQVSAGQLERLMARLPLMFRQELSGVGASLEKRWKFCGFDGLRTRSARGSRPFAGPPSDLK